MTFDPSTEGMTKLQLEDKIHLAQAELPHIVFMRGLVAARNAEAGGVSGYGGAWTAFCDAVDAALAEAGPHAFASSSAPEPENNEAFYAKLNASIKLVRETLVGNSAPQDADAMGAMVDVVAAFVLTATENHRQLERIANAVVAQTKILAAAYSDHGESAARIKAAHDELMNKES